MKNSFPLFKQMDSMDCGPTCLRMVAKFHGRLYSLPFLRERCYIDRAGVSLKGICEAAESIGFRTLAVKVPLKTSDESPSLSELPLPAIVHWDQNHFVVVHKITKSKVLIADPVGHKSALNYEEFEKSFCGNNKKGVALIIEITPEFFKSEEGEESKKGFSFLFKYLTPHKKLILQLVIGILLGTGFQLILPFLTQSLVDVGIDTQNLSFVYIVLAGQLVLFVSQTIVRFIQSWILLHISVRINIGLISDFLMKIMKMPLGFFDSRNTGDILQRISDHDRIEFFLTQSAISTLLSLVNILVFGIVLSIYSIQIFLIFLFSSILYLGWILFFLNKRKEIDHRSFQRQSENQDSLIEIIQGMPEIKLQGSELKRRWKWANIQAKLFKIKMRSLVISQYQDAGAFSINQLKDIVITFIAAKLVLNGEITLGMMLAIQYVIGQLNVPLQQLVGFIRSTQDTSISLERLSEVHKASTEDDANELKSTYIPAEDIVIKDVSFRYTPISNNVLHDLSITIPRGKTTAIVGSSGSGKTTLLKLLLGFYKPTKGTISIGNTNFDAINQSIWRSKCGAVMQDGYIFSDTVANNIAESDDSVDYSKIIEAVNLANISEFIHSLPLGLNTKIGVKGNGISQGQKQRLLIARAIYKNPSLLLFDEATNALDSKSEKLIMNNLIDFIKGKTAVIIAHRLSTVKNADQIIVLENGKIVESGTHTTLVENKNYYYTLIQNQLELGN